MTAEPYVRPAPRPDRHPTLQVTGRAGSPTTPHCESGCSKPRKEIPIDKRRALHHAGESSTRRAQIHQRYIARINSPRTRMDGERLPNVLRPFAQNDGPVRCKAPFRIAQRQPTAVPASRSEYRAAAGSGVKCSTCAAPFTTSPTHAHSAIAQCNGEGAIQSQRLSRLLIANEETA